MYDQNFTQRFFMVNWIYNIHLFLPNISTEVFSKKTIFMIFNSVSFPKPSYKNTFLFIFLSCCVGNLHCEELEKDRNENIQKFDKKKQRELDSLRSFYEQQKSVAFENKAEPPPIAEEQSLMSKSYDFVTEHYLISSFLALIFAFAFFRVVSNSLWFLLFLFKEQLNKLFNSFPKPIQRVLHKERRRFQEVWDYIMNKKDRIL